jgi:hypothetical protein
VSTEALEDQIQYFEGQLKVLEEQSERYELNREVSLKECKQAAVCDNTLLQTVTTTAVQQEIQR